MMAQELQKRNEKSQHLRVMRVNETDYFVESEEGKICYKVSYVDDKENCSCGDFSKNWKADPQFKCKHILAVMNCEHDVEMPKFLKKAQPKLDEAFIITIDGQSFCRYSGLLDLAHQKKLVHLEADILQYPTQENERTAVCKAIARTATGDVFQDLGDANPLNCNSKVSKHLIRMASTRAKARALRDLTNIGMTCLEELGDLDEVIGAEEKGTAQKGKVKPFPKKIVKAEATASHSDNGNGRGTRSTGTVKDASSPGSKEVKEPVKESTKDKKETTTEAKVSEKSGNNGKGKMKADTPPPKMSEAQHRAIMNLSRRRGISVEELEKMTNSTYGVSLEKISPSDASQFIRTLQQSA